MKQNIRQNLLKLVLAASVLAMAIFYMLQKDELRFIGLEETSNYNYSLFLMRNGIVYNCNVFIGGRDGETNESNCSQTRLTYDPIK